MAPAPARDTKAPAPQTSRAAPRRRCVGCGRIAPKSELLRIAVRNPVDAVGEGAQRVAVPDHDARLPGRGAYLCRDASGTAAAPACLERALRRKAFPRALRTAVSVSPELVESVAE